MPVGPKAVRVIIPVIRKKAAAKGMIWYDLSPGGSVSLFAARRPKAHPRDQAGTDEPTNRYQGSRNQAVTTSCVPVAGSSGRFVAADALRPPVAPRWSTSAEADAPCGRTQEQM